MYSSIFFGSNNNNLEIFYFYYFWIPQHTSSILLYLVYIQIWSQCNEVFKSYPSKSNHLTFEVISISIVYYYYLVKVSNFLVKLHIIYFTTKIRTYMSIGGFTVPKICSWRHKSGNRLVECTFRHTPPKSSYFHIHNNSRFYF